MSRKQKKILIVDDDEAVREVTRVTLELLAGWAVSAAGSGKEGIDLAKAEPPDAILLDVMMPEMDGPATLKELCSNPATRQIPVIFLTAKARAAQIQWLRSLGTKGVIPKPFDPLTLASEIEAALGWAPEQETVAERNT